MHAFHADINKRLSIVSAPSSMMGDAIRKDSTMYVGAYEFCSNSSDKYFFANGYIDIEQGHVKAYCYYANDHLGNVSHVDRAGLDNRGNEIVQVSNYYSYGGVHTDVDNGVDVQNHLYNGKELDRMHGLNLYDYSARQYDPALGQFTSMDPLCEKYYHISPYAYCAGNPVKYVDPDGKKVYLFATKLPGTHVPLATHTFLAITNSSGDVIKYAAYGPENGNPFGGDRLMKINYSQDKQVYTDFFSGKSNDNLKLCQEVPVPEGMTSEQFDSKVIKTVNSFGNEQGISYAIIPLAETEGNCNTSSSTILIKSGVASEVMSQLEENIPGINTGFQTESPRPWTKEEQKQAVEREYQRLIERE